LKNEILTVGVAGLLIAVFGAGYFVSQQTGNTPPTGSSSSQVCISNINSPPQDQYVSVLHQIVTTPSFIQYSNGRCWTWDSTFILSGPAGSSDVFVFTHFSNEIWYPCGTPAFAPDAIIHVVPSYASDKNVTGVSIELQSPPYGVSCPAG